jgi:hypothetical protein
VKPILSFLLVVTQLSMGLAPILGVQQAQAADKPAAWRKLDNQLRMAGEARVLVQSDWLLVRSPRAAEDGLHFAAMSESVSSGLSPAAGLSWERVDAIQLRRTGTGRGAIAGGLILGTAAGVTAGVLSSELGIQPTYEVDPGAVVGGAAMGFLAGALLGAAVGTGFQRWVRVYP